MSRPCATAALEAIRTALESRYGTRVEDDDPHTVLHALHQLGYDVVKRAELPLRRLPPVQRIAPTDDWLLPDGQLQGILGGSDGG